MASCGLYYMRNSFAAQVITEALRSMFAAYGLLKEIILDKRHSVKCSRSAAYLLASDGSVQHFTQTLKKNSRKKQGSFATLYCKLSYVA